MLDSLCPTREGDEGNDIPAKICTAEIPLDDDLFQTLCRRSRKRLRDLQDKCNATVKLDRARGSLQVFGTDESIQIVRHHLESLSGPRKLVTAALWAELMRTRTTPSTAKASVDGLQQATGCRVHIERSHCEVRLFGCHESTDRAAMLLDEVAEECMEENVELPKGSPVIMDGQLQHFANQFGVTFLQKGERCVTVLGLRDCVTRATTELRKQVAEQNIVTIAKAKQEPPKAAEKLEFIPGTPKTRHEPEEPPAGKAKTAQEPATNHLVDGQYIGFGFKLGKPRQEHQILHVASQVKQECCTCCGCGSFCTECGAPLQQADDATPNSGFSTPTHQQPWVPQPRLMQSYGPCGEQWYAEAPCATSQQNQPYLQSTSQIQAFQYPIVMVSPGMPTDAPNLMMMGLGGCVSVAPASFVGNSESMLMNPWNPDDMIEMQPWPKVCG